MCLEENAMDQCRCTDGQYFSVFSRFVENVEFSMRVGSGVGYISFLDVPAVRLLCTN